MRKSLLNVVLASTTALCAVPALAQEAAPRTEGLKEIVVTAQRREENLQKVPIAVTAIGADTLDQLRVTNFSNVASLAPNLGVTTQGLASNPQINIRGIASGVSNNGVDPKIGIYLDGVTLARPESLTPVHARQSWVERDEVLRKPLGFSQGFIKEETHLFCPNTTMFGHPGAGGSLGMADPTAGVALGYVMNKMGPYVRSPRALALCHALYRSPGLQAGQAA